MAITPPLSPKAQAAARQAQHGMPEDDATKLTAKFQARYSDFLAQTNDTPNLDIAEAYKTLTTDEPLNKDQYAWFTGKDAPDVDHYEIELKKRAETLAQMREFMMKSTEGGKGTFSSMLAGLTPSLEGPPAQVKVNAVRDTTRRFFSNKGFTAEQAFAASLVVENAAQPNLFQEAGHVLLYSGIAIPDFAVKAWQAGKEIDVTSGEWKQFEASIAVAGPKLTGGFKEVFDNASIEVTRANRDARCGRVWSVLADLNNNAGHYISVSRPLTAREMEGMPAGLRKQVGDNPTLGDMVNVLKGTNIRQYATEITGNYSNTTAQAGMHNYNTANPDNLRIAMGMPDNTKIHDSVAAYVDHGITKGKTFDHGQHGIDGEKKVTALGFSKPVYNRDVGLPPPVRR